MKAKEYFLKVAQTEKRLKVLLAKLRHFEELGLTITSNTSAVGGHQAGTSRVELAAIGMVDSMRGLKNEISQYSKLISEAQQVINQIPQEKFRDILTYRYLCGWSLQSISDQMGYKDRNSVYRAHGWALAEAQKIMNREEKERDGNML